MKKVILDLTPEEYFALTRNYPMGDQLYYIWVGSYDIKERLSIS